ncbi:MAG: NUDIX domain-containing protein [Microcella sp.]
MSDYVAGMRELIGTRLLFFPAVTALILDSDGRLLVGHHTDTGRWSLIGGAIDPGEEPESALRREVAEELGVEVASAELLGVYGGPEFCTTYPNGDEAAFVTIAYVVTLSSHNLTHPDGEITRTTWIEPGDAAAGDMPTWTVPVIADLASWLRSR